jgi:hypothetical protein
MSSAFYSSSIPDGTTSATYKTAAQSVYQMPELLRIIVHYLRKHDLLNLALAAKEGFSIPASELYKRFSHKLFSRLFDQGCDPVSGVRRWSFRSMLNRSFPDSIVGSLCDIHQRSTRPED